MAINSDADRSLCHRCQSLPLSTLFYGPHNPKLNETFFHPLHVVWAATTCKFCLLIQGLLKSHYGKDYIAAKLEGGFDQELRLYRNPLDLSFDEYHMQGREGQEMPFFLQIGCLGPRAHAGNPAAHFRREDRARSDEGSREWVMPSIFAVKHEIDYADRSVGSVSVEQPGRLVDCRGVDWALIALWDASCPHHVMGATFQKSDNPEDSYRSRLRVIDVENACVTRCPSTTPYVALSYQWGSDQKLKLKKENITLLETPGFFATPEGEPAQTIRDAIVTVKRLGYKYAWVDALCIVQDDVENVVLNVDQMDQIYRGAHLTIVAAAGENAYYGLPGVSTTPRAEVQLKAVVGDTLVASMLETGQGAIDFSRWSRRAWTCDVLITHQHFLHTCEIPEVYLTSPDADLNTPEAEKLIIDDTIVDQERLLSNRLLTFTDSQVFFNCSAGCNFQEQYHFIPDSAQTYTLADPQASFDFETRDLWELYGIGVAEYTKRAMSDPLDKTRAFNGILKFFERPFGAPFLHGLPTNLFEVALLWKPRGPCRRNAHGFPSWSWAGWDADVIYEPSDSMNNVCECTVSQAMIRVPQTDIPLTSYTASPPQNLLGWHRHFDDDELAIHYTSTDPEYASYRYPRPLPRTHLTRFASLNSPILHITGKIATFQLTEKHSHMRDIHTRMKTPCKDGLHELCYLAILDAQKNTAGTIIVPGHLLPQLVDKSHRFLAVARSTLSRMDDDPSWDPKAKSFTPWAQQAIEPRPRDAPRSSRAVEVLQPGGKFDWKRDEDENDDEAFHRNFRPPNDEFFDDRHFSDQVYWPAMNVLLLSEERNGVVERVGVGKIHVDAFEDVAVDAEVWLG